MSAYGSSDLAPLPAGYGLGGASGQPQTITINLTTTLDGQTVARQVLRLMPDQIRNATGTRHM
jgi:hypothetical protein